jgi:protein tyrosine kinase modulator
MSDLTLSDIRYYLGVLKRRFVLVLIPAIAAFALAIALTFMIPPVYQSAATILVQAQQIPEDLVRSTVTASAVERVQVIEQRVMTRENLLRIAEKYKLSSGDDSQAAASDVVDSVRNAVAIEQVLLSTSSRRNPEAVAFRVSFDYRDPVVAAQVANELVAMILDEDLRTRTEQAAETKRFLMNEVGRITRELDSVDAQITEYKRQHSENLPESLSYRQSLLLRAQTELALLDRDISTLEEQSPGNGAPVGDLINQVRLELARARATYTESHPTVKRLVQQLNELESAAQSQQNAAAAQASSGNTNVTRDAATQAKLDSMHRDRDDLQKRIADLEDSIAQTGQVELGLSGFLREQDDLQRELREANAKLSQAETAERLEENRQSERLEVIEQPIVPQSPIRPNRPMILALGLFASAAVGLGPVVAFEALDPSLKRERDVEKKLGQRALAVIPLIDTRGDIRRRKRFRFLVLLLLVLLVAAVAAAIHQYFVPLDELWYRVLEVLNSIR